MADTDHLTIIASLSSTSRLEFPEMFDMKEWEKCVARNTVFRVLYLQKGTLHNNTFETTSRSLNVENRMSRIELAKKRWHVVRIAFEIATL